MNYKIGHKWCIDTFHCNWFHVLISCALLGHLMFSQERYKIYILVDFPHQSNSETSFSSPCGQSIVFFFSTFASSIFEGSLGHCGLVKCSLLITLRLWQSIK